MEKRPLDLMLIRTDAEAEEIAARQYEIPGSQRTSIPVDTLLRDWLCHLECRPAR